MSVRRLVLCSLSLLGCILSASPRVLAETGSCRTETKGKFECMEFTGTIPPYISATCGAGAQTAKWLDEACPKEDVLGSCTIPRNDGVIQVDYCYRMPKLTDQKRIEYCRTGCSGTFSPIADKSAAEVSPPPKAVAPSHAPVSEPGAVRGATAGADDEYPMEMSTNRFGEDYSDLDLPAPDPKLCAEACANQARCKAWTMVKPGIQAEGAKCWLKERVPAPSPDECCISGLKPKKRVDGLGQRPAAGADEYSMEMSTNRFGEDYSDLDLSTPDPKLCAEACAKQPRCKAWTMVKPGIQAEGAKCWLKERVPAASPDECCISGVKPRKK